MTEPTNQADANEIREPEVTTQPANPANENEIREAEATTPRRLGPLEMKHWEEFLLRFGGRRSGPRTKAELETLAGFILNRYDWEDALKYVDGANNRLLNKARGLITFNGLTLAAISTLVRVEGVQAVNNALAGFGIIMALLSAGILLWTHFLVDFGRELSDYEDTPSEFRSYVVLVATRAKWIVITGFLSFLSLLPLLLAHLR